MEQLTFSSGAFVTLLPSLIPLVCFPASPHLSSWLLALWLKCLLGRNPLLPPPQKGLYGLALLQLIRAGFPPGRHQAGHGLEVPLPDPTLLGLLKYDFFVSQVDHRKGRRVRKGTEMKLPPKWSRQLYLPLGKAPRAQQREPHSHKSYQDCLCEERGLEGFFCFFFKSPSKSASRKSFSSLPPSLHTNINSKVMQKPFPSFQSWRIRKSAGETTLWQPQLTGSSTGMKESIKKN